MIASILLEPEQKELLCDVVEASRNVPRERREQFFAYETMGTTLAHLQHPGLPKEYAGAYMGDIKTLASQGLLSLEYGTHGTVRFDVSPLGFKHYEVLKRSQASPLERMEATVRTHLDAFDFRSRYPTAYQKWLEAENLLWSGETTSDLTTIGHLARESLQLFASALVETFKPRDVDPDVSHTISRLKSVLLAEPAPSDTDREFLLTLVAHFGNVSDLAQRQEHGAQREKSSLAWEDGRRIVFHAAIIMFEIDRALRRMR